MTKYVVTDTPNFLFAVDDTGGQIRGILSNNGEFSEVVPHYDTLADRPDESSNQGRPWTCRVGEAVYSTNGVSNWTRTDTPNFSLAQKPTAAEFGIGTFKASTPTYDITYESNGISLYG